MSIPANQQSGELPKFVGKYRIVRLIAKSNDTVYEAIDPHLDRHIALKELTLPPNLSGAARRERIERFQREAKAAGALTHPHIVTIYEVGQHLEHRFIAMEYLVGQTLREVIAVGGPLPVLEAIEIALQLCEALGYAHAQGVVHRDVKPDNIYLVGPSRTVKLTDFGIARMMAEPSLTTAGQVFGTPAYMSPEQLSSREVDYRSDIFALGIVLYEMLTGIKPFRGDSVITITYQIMNAEPEIPASVAPGLASIIGRALFKDPDLRYQSLRALAADLQREQRFLLDTPARERAALLAAAAQEKNAQAPEPTLYSESATTEFAMNAESAAAPETLGSADETRLPTRRPIYALSESDDPSLAENDFSYVPGGSKPSDVFQNASQAAQPQSAPAAFIASLNTDAVLRGAAFRLLASALIAWILVIAALFKFIPESLDHARQAHIMAQAAISYREAAQLAVAGKFDDSIAGYEIARRLGGTISPVFNRRCLEGLADCYTAEGARAQAQGNLAIAQQLYSQATASDPQNTVALFDSATAYQAASDPNSALRAFTQAYQSAPKSPVGGIALDQAQQGYLQLGEQSFAQGSAPAARENWQMAQNLDPQSAIGQQAAARLRQTQ